MSLQTKGLVLCHIFGMFGNTSNGSWQRLVLKPVITFLGVLQVASFQMTLHPDRLTEDVFTETDHPVTAAIEVG